MRVFLPWRAANQLHISNENAGDEEQTQEVIAATNPTEAAAASTRKRPAVAEKPQETEPIKRPRLDSKPPAVDSKEMTAGPPINPADDSDDEKLPASAHWPPLENKPQDAFSSPTSITIRSNAAEPIDHSSLVITSTTTAKKPDSSSPNAEAILPSFEQSLQQRGLEIVEMTGDGNCLFRAVALQVYGDDDMHSDVRNRVCDFMQLNPEHFSEFVVDETFAQYVHRKRQDGVHGNNPEIQAISELFNRPVQVFTPDSDVPLNIFQKDYKTDDHPIRLSYHDGNHYNAVIDPLKPTAGLGLGLPGLKIGLADELQVSKAITESDIASDQMELKRALEESTDDEVQRVMKESRMHQEDALQRVLKESTYEMDYNLYKSKSLALSDVDATNFEMEQAILQNSIESYRRHEHGRKQRASPTVGRRRRASPIQSVASVPSSSCEREGPPFDDALFVPPSAAAAFPPVAYAASASPPSPPPAALGTVDEYPQTVQELVMNGFELSKVVHAMELIGDNFDDVLAFLMSTSYA